MVYFDLGNVLLQHRSSLKMLNGQMCMQNVYHAEN